MSALLPDHDHYKGSASGRVFALWKDAAGTDPNVSLSALAELGKTYGALSIPSISSPMLPRCSRIPLMSSASKTT